MLQKDVTKPRGFLVKTTLALTLACIGHVPGQAQTLEGVVVTATRAEQRMRDEE